MARISRKQFISYDELDSATDLTAAEQATWQAARDATGHAYAPYSGFHVGAALLLADGTIFRGTNQENAAYPSGLCAERTALFGLAASQPQHGAIVGMAVAARPIGGDFGPALPCGACRQVMLEYEARQGRPIPLLLPSRAGTILRFKSLSSLMPFNFSADDLPVL
ncbi:cytidine deaminase [Hymenobacter humi]|uniref:Cytidine deaminase n=1 Tax=Hymenobacter humi TaxID=1411620 RepID=A0ABW2U597_9BACT